MRPKSGGFGSAEAAGGAVGWVPITRSLDRVAAAVVHTSSQFRGIAMHVLTLGFFAFVLLLVPRESSAYEMKALTECGQVLEGTYYLTGDLDCTGVPGHGVDLTSRRSRVELRGFTLSNASSAGIQCRQSCTIIGPGTITGSASFGVRVGRRAHIIDVTLTNNGNDAVSAEDNGDNGRAIVENCHVEGNGAGVRGDKRVVLIDSAVVNNTGGGVIVNCQHGRKKIENSIVTGNGVDFTCF
jgi:hypothetical protein